MVLDRGEASVCIQHPGFDSDLVVTSTTPALAEVFAGLDTWAHALASDAIRIDGPPSLAKRLPRWFLGSPFADVTREMATPRGGVPEPRPGYPPTLAGPPWRRIRGRPDRAGAGGVGAGVVPRRTRPPTQVTTAPPFPQHMFNRVVEQVVPTVVDSVDIDALLERVDVDALLRRIDVDGLLDRIDIDRLMARVDVQALIDRVDVGGLIERVDLDAVLAEVDINALMERIDVQAIAERAQIGDLVAQSTRDVAGSTIDLARRQLVALDLLVLRLVQRVLKRRGAAMEAGPAALLAAPPVTSRRTARPKGEQVTGRFAGAASRLTEFGIDCFTIVLSYGIAANIFVFLVRVVLGVDVNTSNTDNNWWLFSYLTWALFYFWFSTAITGRTIGKWLVGVRIVEVDATPLRTGPALVRVLVLPISIAVFGLGLVGIVIGKQRRAWHDRAAGTVVVYDWGDRPAEMPAPLTRWLSRQGTMELSADGTNVEDLGPADQP